MRATWLWNVVLCLWPFRCTDTLTRTPVFAVALLAGPSAAEDLVTYNRAMSAYEGNQFEESAVLFFEVVSHATDKQLRGQAEFSLASSFQRSQMSRWRWERKEE